MARRTNYHRVSFSLTLLLLTVSGCQAQDAPQDHSCTLSGAGEFVKPFGTDGKNFNDGWGFQGAGGFAVTPDHGARLFLIVDFMYDRLDATAAALAGAQATPVVKTQLAPATAAHGDFTAVTLDPTVRIPATVRTSFYLSGGFGWLRRGVDFNSANPATLTQSAGFTLDRLATRSGALDFGGGVNFGLTHKGGLMLFAEARVYHGLAVNRGTTLLPISVGLRW